MHTLVRIKQCKIHETLGKQRDAKPCWGVAGEATLFCEKHREQGFG